MVKKIKIKVGSAKCDQSYNKIIKRKNLLIQKQWEIIQKRNSKIIELNNFLDDLLKNNRVTKDELVERFKKSSVNEEDFDDDENPFFKV